MSKTVDAESLTIDDLIICEDVRYEVNNKVTLIGVFSADLVVQSFPAPGIKIAIYASLHIPSIGHRTFEIVIKFAEADIIKAEGEIEVLQPGHSMLAIPQMNIGIPEEGDLEIMLSLDKGAATRKVKKHVGQGNVVSPGLIPPAGQ